MDESEQRKMADGLVNQLVSKSVVQMRIVKKTAVEIYDFTMEMGESWAFTHEAYQKRFGDDDPATAEARGFLRAVAAIKGFMLGWHDNDTKSD